MLSLTMTAAVYASEDKAIALSNQFLSETNPAAAGRTMAIKAANQSLRVLRNNIVTHAGTDMGKKDCGWFRNPELSLEYNFNYNNDTRSGGLDTDIHGATGGLGIMTCWDLSVGALLSVSHADGDAANTTAGAADDVQSQTTTAVGTLYISKSFWDWFFVGGSASFAGGCTDTKYGTANVKTNSGTQTLSVYTGAFTNEGNWSFSTVPTYAVSMQACDTSTEADSSSSTGTIIWSNNIGYSFTDKFFASLNITPNFVVHDEAALGAVRGDDLWVNFGLSDSYQVDETWSLTGSYSYDAFNNDYENHNVNVGAICRF